MPPSIDISNAPSAPVAPNPLDKPAWGNPSRANTSWPKKSSLKKSWQPKDLPQFYYHTNFCEMLDFVEARNAHILDEQHEHFLTRFRALPFPAQLAYVRIAGRKGRVFNVSKLAYDEIENLPAQFEILRHCGFVRELHAADYPDYLNVLTKPELLDILALHLTADGYKKSWAKGLLIETVTAHVPFERLSLPGHFIIQGQMRPLQFLMYLYFGKIEDNLQNFTLRDLGLVKTPDFKPDYGARFETRPMARAAYFYAKALHDFRNGDDKDTTVLISSLEDWPQPECEISSAARDKLLQKLGGRSERLGDIETALSTYARSQTPLCNERVIRLRYAQGDKDWVKARLETLIDNPGSDSEYHFAQDFYARKYNGKRTSIVTDILREGQILRLDEAYRNQPERAAKWAYEARGFATYRTENHLWRGLFGLLFWDELFDTVQASLHNSFERVPAALKTRDFYPAFKDRIEAKLASLSNPETTFVRLLQTYSQHQGTGNGIFRWSGTTLDTIKTFLPLAPPDSLAHMLRLMAKDYPNTKDGFPDLMRVKDGRVCFTEVKASGDVIRRNQLTRIQQLRTAGFATDIARIEWVIDPNQIYVVVDVETTGGRAGLHRLTEIGAVKLQGGEIIDEWSSLLNPERSIPSMITRLTGISQDMVKDAPLFHEVADSFAAFMGESIFAAHNVNFDYGFISHEFSRMDRHFRHPKICTCASMRRLYPGHKSYSLKNLCESFQIDLTSHHRALCDAKAAAELLKLVNLKRLE